MTGLREAAQMALDALTYIYTETTADEDKLIHASIEALRAALAQPEQEPQGGYRWRKGDVPPSITYAAPSQREWQGLTDQDYEAMAEKYVTNCYFDTLKYARAIEAKLKEKNNG